MVDESTTPDGELLRAQLAGDATAFATLIRRHQTWMWATARAMLGNREDALDAVQQALIRAFRSAHTWRGDGSVTSWLYRIVARVTLDVVALWRGSTFLLIRRFLDPAVAHRGRLSPLLRACARQLR